MKIVSQLISISSTFVLGRVLKCSHVKTKRLKRATLIFGSNNIHQPFPSKFLLTHDQLRTSLVEGQWRLLMVLRLCNAKLGSLITSNPFESSAMNFALNLLQISPHHCVEMSLLRMRLIYWSCYEKLHYLGSIADLKGMLYYRKSSILQMLRVTSWPDENMHKGILAQKE